MTAFDDSSYEPFALRMTVTKCEEAYRGYSHSTGGEYVMYDVLALDESGEPITSRLRSYEQLPLDQLGEFEVHPYDNEQYGRSYTIKPLKQKSSGARLGPKVDELRERSKKQSKVIDALIAHVAGAEVGSADHRALRDKIMAAAGVAEAGGHPGGSSEVESTDSEPSGGSAGPAEGTPKF